MAEARAGVLARHTAAARAQRDVSPVLVVTRLNLTTKASLPVENGHVHTRQKCESFADNSQFTASYRIVRQYRRSDSVGLSLQREGGDGTGSLSFLDQTEQIKLEETSRNRFKHCQMSKTQRLGNEDVLTAFTNLDKTKLKSECLRHSGCFLRATLHNNCDTVRAGGDVDSASTWQHPEKTTSPIAEKVINASFTMCNRPSFLSSVVAHRRFKNTGKETRRTDQIRAEQSRAEQNGTKWNGTKWNRTEQSRAEQNGTEQSRAERNGTEQSRTEQSRAEQNRTERNRTEQSRTEWNRTEQNRTERNRTEQNRTEQNGMKWNGVKWNRTEQNKTEQNRTVQNRTEQNSTEQNRTEQNKTEQNRTVQNRTEQNRTEQNKMEQNRTKRNRTEQDGTEQNRTVQNRTERNRTERNRTEQNRTEQNRTEQNRTKRNRTEQSRTERNRAERPVGLWTRRGTGTCSGRGLRTIGPA
ncbi:hypothetical protein Q9233_017322 [Columba guinea]|nr:hypothetical protein Q9233_017322 [Columba guinea]